MACGTGLVVVEKCLKHTFFIIDELSTGSYYHSHDIHHDVLYLKHSRAGFLARWGLAHYLTQPRAQTPETYLCSRSD